jgi:hypothetical protein
MQVLPDDYESIQTKKYFNPQPGESRIRILSQFIFGWEDWDQKVPIRHHYSVKPPKPVDLEKPCKVFMATIIWHYDSNKLLVWSFKNFQLREELESLLKTPSYSSAFDYDICVRRKGQGPQTAYSLTAFPKTPLSKEIKKKALETPCNLRALYDSKDPFQCEESERTILEFEEEPI